MSMFLLFYSSIPYWLLLYFLELNPTSQPFPKQMLAQKYTTLWASHLPLNTSTFIYSDRLLMTSLLTCTKQHCLIGICGTVHHSTDLWFVHCNVSTHVFPLSQCTLNKPCRYGCDPLGGWSDQSNVQATQDVHAHWELLSQPTAPQALHTHMFPAPQVGQHACWWWRHTCACCTDILYLHPN